RTAGRRASMRALLRLLLPLGLGLLCLPLSAALRLELHDEKLDPDQRKASQLLLDQALQALPPTLIERLDRRVAVVWRNDLPANAFGRASGPYGMDHDRQLVPALTDDGAASRRSGRPHGTLERGRLATLRHELGHLYGRGR